MKVLNLPVLATLLLPTLATANETFLGNWSSGATEVLRISKDDNGLTAEFVRESVKAEFEKVRFPARMQDGMLVITGEQGDLSARYDEGNKLLILGGMKAFQKLTPKQADALIAALKKN